MDLAKLKQKGKSLWRKYRYAALIVLLGIVLMLVPAKKEGGTNQNEITTEPPIKEVSVEQQLSQILCQIRGAGNVKVMLTVASGAETIYQTDSDVSVADDSSTSQVKTVIVNTSQKDETGVIRQVNPPAYMGAIVVCEGADQPSVQLAIVEAVSVVTGLGADRISILKMK